MKEGLFSEYGLICLTDLDKRRLNNLARTALLTKNADVIISLGAQQVISREFKPAKTHMTWKKILIQKPRIRFPRADMDIPVKKHFVHNWETCCKNYRATRRLCSSHYRKHFSNTEVQRCIIHRWTYQEFDEKLRRAVEGGAIERLYQTKPPCEPLLNAFTLQSVRSRTITKNFVLRCSENLLRMKSAGCSAPTAGVKSKQNAFISRRLISMSSSFIGANTSKIIRNLKPTKFDA